MRELVTNNVIDINALNDGQSGSSFLEDLGHLCFTELSELRHRGAFSTAAQTFAALCQQCALAKDVRTRALLQGWYMVSDCKRFLHRRE